MSKKESGCKVNIKKIHLKRAGIRKTKNKKQKAKSKKQKTKKKKNRVSLLHRTAQPQILAPFPAWGG